MSGTPTPSDQEDRATLEWRLAEVVIRFPRPVMVMGILNVTPDSFSDGGRFLTKETAIEHGLEMVAQGADLIDVGGESTRPGSKPVSVEDELERVIPVIQGLSRRTPVPLSIDTQKPEVAAAAMRAGAKVINDVAANRKSPSMARVVTETGAGYVCVHMQGTPQTMQTAPSYVDVEREICDFFHDQLRFLSEHGVPAEQVVFDVGIGFGKSLEHNLQLLASLASFRRIERPLLLGASRKSFMGRLLDAETGQRLAASLACVCWAAQSGVGIIRVHDVQETVHASRMTEEILARRHGNFSQST